MLEGLANHYPEKTFYLGQVFNDTTNSYKLVWFMAILSLLQRSESRVMPLASIFTEMAAVAWHPVCLFRLSLGGQDKLHHAILGLHRQSQLPPNAPSEAIREFVQGSREAQEGLDHLKRYVPTRFLTPWFTDRLRDIADFRRDAKIRELARESQKTPFASPYWFDSGNIAFNQSWQVFLVENMAVMQGFGEHHLALYLQTRNPNVPGIVHKLSAPTERQLDEARQFWQVVRLEFNKLGRVKRFRDIYSDLPLANNFSIDHFLPWSFVAHGLLWNLAPVQPATNSAKNDVLPDLDLYLPRLASLHFDAIEAAKQRPKMLEDYTECFKLDVSGLLSLGADGLAAKFREVILPQAQIAINQGFQSGWKLPVPDLVATTRRELVLDELPDRTARFHLGEDGPQRLVEHFQEGSPQQTLGEYLPYYSLAVAAGGFLAGDAPDPEGWVNVAKHGFSKRISDGMFVTRIVGKSMEPIIRDGSYCVFRRDVGGTRQGRVVLVQKRGLEDPETGGGYTVKRYESTKSTNEDGWKHDSIRLVPANLDREKFPILEFSSGDDADLRVVAEFVEMLTPGK